MGSVDDPTVILGIGVCLCSQFETEVLDQVGGRTSEGLGDAWKVGHNGPGIKWLVQLEKKRGQKVLLDSVAFSFNLGLQALHLVAVEGVGNVPTNIDGSHVDEILVGKSRQAQSTFC